MIYLKYSCKVGLYGALVAIVITPLLWLFLDPLFVFPALLIFPSFMLFGGFPDKNYFTLTEFAAAILSNFFLYWLLGNFMWLGHRDDRLMWVAPAAVLAFYTLLMLVLMGVIDFM